jgi:hypothetical protein
MSDKFYLTQDESLKNTFKLIDPKLNTGDIAKIDSDGMVYLDWSKIESAALRADLARGPIIDRTMWAFAVALLAVRDKTWIPLNK